VEVSLGLADEREALALVQAPRAAIVREHLERDRLALPMGLLEQ
jgi:hypothetical protein